MITMYDSVDVTQIPADAQAVAGYINGAWPTFSSLKARFPGALLLSIAVSADADADCLDVEPGDAVPAQAPAWVRRQLARGTSQPVLYASASAMPAVRAALAAAGVDPAVCRYWSAHYTGRAHICGPDSCGALPWKADGTQWTSSALGRNLDQSLLDDGFFPWQDALMTTLPLLKQGSTGQAVKNWQGLLIGHGYSPGSTGPARNGVDGAFGVQTDAVTRSFQRAKGLTVDGVVGPATWTAALSG